MASRYSTDDVLTMLQNDSDSASEFEVSENENSDAESSDEGASTLPLVQQRGRGRARTPASGLGRRRGASVGRRGRGRGRDGGLGRGTRTPTPKEFVWRPVELHDDFDHHLNWVGQPNRKGILIDTSGFQPTDFFKYFFPDDVFELMASHTNLYARQYLENRNIKQHSRYQKWTETSALEMKAYVALQIAMGINSKPEVPDYWSTYWLTANKFSDIMSRNRYQLLNAFLHFNDNDQRVDRGQDGYDPLFKVRPLLDITDPRLLSAYAPDEELSIDESMIKFKGRIFFRQYLPAKPTKWGIKTFALCESNTGYALRLLVYTGRDTFECDRASEFSITEQVCLEMVKGFENRGYTLYMDNFYTSPRLFQELKRKGIGACGTVKPNRKYMPFDLQPQTLHLQKGDDPVFMCCDDLVTCAMMDTKRVHFLSSVHSDNTFEKTVRDRKEESGRRSVVRPVMCDAYNAHMNGVDVMDQKLGSYNYPHKCAKWYMTIVHRIREVALVNGYILYCKSVPDGNNPLPPVEFRERVIDGLLEGWTLCTSKKGKPSTSEKPDRLTGRHFPAQYEEASYRPDCIVCSDRAKQRRVQTRYFCRNCNKAMCPTECFMLFHTQKDFKAAVRNNTGQ